MRELIFCIAIVASHSLASSQEITVADLGTIRLPKGEWTLEYIRRPEKETKRPDSFVFRKAGKRLERIAIVRYRPAISQKKAYMYADSIGDSYAHGIPLDIAKDSALFEECELISRPRDWNADELELTYVYTSKTEATWMSHAIITVESDWVVIGVHSSPFAISPDTIRNVTKNWKISYPSK